MSEKQLPHVLQAVVAIEKAMSSEGIGKDRQNEQQRYKFRGIDDVLNALAAKYAENDIFVVPSYADRVLHEYENKSGGRVANVTLWGTFKMVSARDGSELVAGPFPGEAMDSADKATNKAMSAAYKYFAIQTFSIPTEGDNDADATTHEVQRRAPASATARAVQARQQAIAAQAGVAPPASAEPAAAPPAAPEVDLTEVFQIIAAVADVNSLREVKDDLLKNHAGTGNWPQIKAKIEARLQELRK